MADNSSFSSNDSNPIVLHFCLQIHPYSIILPTIFFTISIFLLPLYVFILHHGLQQCRKKSSTMSHSDCFTYNMVLMELVSLVGHLTYFCEHLRNFDEIGLGFNVMSFSYMGKMYLHLMTCAERYLAVVHPITYMRLKNSEWIRIRNVSIVCVWMFSGASAYYAPDINRYLIAIVITAVSFFSLSVLLVLVRPGPGEQGGNRQWADPSKKRAFFTIVAILGVLMVKFSGDWSYEILYQPNIPVVCVLQVYLTLLELPNNLVIPLLFLLRHGRRKNKQ